MRYFLTTVADRPVNAGGRTFNFDPVSLRGGSWVGVLALDEESGASILCDAGHPSVSEITIEQYESEKKKQPQSTARSARPQAPVSDPSQAGVRVADRAGRVIDPTIAEPAAAGAPAAELVTGSVELQTTSEQPPDEAMLAEPEKRRFS